jgi:hypothetical protein
VNVFDNVTLVPVLHGKSVFSRRIRDLCLKEKFDCIAVDIQEQFQEELKDAVQNLPIISAVMAKNMSSDTVYYIPTDPCDAMIEGIRQTFQNHIPFFCIGNPKLANPPELPQLPDEYAASQTGIDIYDTMCIQAIGDPGEDTKNNSDAQFLAHKILSLKSNFKNILAIVHYRNFVRTIDHLSKEETHNLSYPSAEAFTIATSPVYPDHLYFALGELPFITGKCEKERYDLFAPQFNTIDAIKDLFRETRDEYFDDKDEIATLSPARIQAALTFLRNLTIMSGNFIPSLLDIIESAKGVGGNAYAIRILKSAKYYPYFAEEQTNQVQIGIEKIKSDVMGGTFPAINLFRDFKILWRTISIKPDPSLEKKTKFRYSWNPYGMCSHVPEDDKIENFNTHVRKKAQRILTEDYVKNEKFVTSVKDGIDIRETLRNWHTGNIYVKEIPPSRGNVDTVVIIFDDQHDDKYPHCTTWYSEHQEESTLSFYATDPFANLIGPGIAQCTYGGLSLLFPPRSIPDGFSITDNLHFPNLASRLTYSALLFSQEKNVAYIAVKKPSAYLKNMANKLKKHLIWIPLSSFSNETLRKLRRFHILNGKTVRSWATRFIGD